MITVKYYFSSNKKWFDDFATSFSDATGHRVEVQNNSLILPPELGQGRFEFYELTEGLSVVLTDCVFYEDICLHRTSIAENEHYKLFFNISHAPIVIYHQSGEMVNVGESLAESVFFSSHNTAIKVNVGAEQRLRSVQLIFHRTWGIVHLLTNPTPLSISRVVEYASINPIKFTTNLDLRCYELVEEMLSTELPPFTALNYLEGCACQLLGLFFKNMVEVEIREDKVTSAYAMRIIQLKEKIERDLSEKVPTLEEAARECLLSRTRFGSMFKTLFNCSYGLFFKKIRMNKAKIMLLQGASIREISEMSGYVNVGDFAKAFKRYFGIRPSVYRGGGI